MTALVALHSSPVWLPRTQTWMYEQVKHLPASIEAHVVCERRDNADQFDLPRIHCLADGPAVRLWWDKALRKLGARRHLGLLVEVARRHGASLLHSHFGHIGWLDLEAARQAGLAHVVTFYGQDVVHLPRTEPIWVERYREMFASVDRVLCEGPHMASRIADLGCPREKLVVHELGIDTERFAFRPRRWDKKGPLRVLLCGTFTEKKGLPYALRALGEIGRVIPLAVTLVGDANATERQQHEKREILRAIAECGLERDVRLTGYLPHAEIVRLAHEHHVLVAPSVTASDGDTEGGAPVTICELAATGMPVVATRHCDIPHVVEDGVGALLAAERDVAGLVECLRRLVHEPALWDSLARAARRRIEERFDVRRRGAALAEVYAEACAARRGGTRVAR